MPTGMLGAYRRFLENMTIYNTIGGGIGKGYREKTSIPQGDPLSMMVAALLMRPWSMEMKGMAMHTRTLAGDLQLISTGPNHLKHFVAGRRLSKRERDPIVHMEIKGKLIWSNC